MLLFVLLRQLTFLGVFGCIFFPTVFSWEEREGGEGEERGAGGKPNYYEIYEAIHTLNTLTPHHTFYELLGISPTATDEELGRAFRRLSFQYHPDKVKDWDEQTERLSKLVQFVGSLMRDPQGRRDYDWVLNEAPAWHRQTYYYMGKLVQTAKLSLLQVAVIVLLFSIGLPLLVQWIGYASEWYLILSSRWALSKLGDKEVKRMRKRVVSGDPTFLAMTSSSYHTLLSADRPIPKIPSPLDLWIFRLPLTLFKLIWQKLLMGTFNTLLRPNEKKREKEHILSPPQSPMSKGTKAN